MAELKFRVIKKSFRNTELGWEHAKEKHAHVAFENCLHAQQVVGTPALSAWGQKPLYGVIFLWHGVSYPIPSYNPFL